MRNAILHVPKQFAFDPVIENGPLIGEFRHMVVAGMGGSHLAADLIKIADPSLSLTIHSDYGLPFIAEEHRKRTLVIASSYSGNTEETIDAYQTARAQGLAVAAIAVGGALIEHAKSDHVPFIQLPDTGIQPRSATGFSLRAFLKLMGKEELLHEAQRLAQDLRPEIIEPDGKALAARLIGRVPIIYASRVNGPIACNWKIKFNETGKIPAFWNVFPELNHNEMTSFDPNASSRELSERLTFIFLRDKSDHPRIQKRMEITSHLLKDRGFPVEMVELSSDVPIFQKIFESLLLADWTALFTAEHYGLESEQVPMVEELKQSLVD